MFRTGRTNPRVGAPAFRPLSSGTCSCTRVGQRHARRFGEGVTHRSIRTRDVREKNVNVTDSRSARSDSEPSGALVSALTTEHYTLQAARSSTVAEANGRGLIFLSTVSGAMVALALVAQVDRLGHQTFLVFALSILPALLVLGLTSYARLADLAVHDAYYARGIGRIRAFYFTLDPSAHQYWLLTPGDDLHALMRQAGQPHSRWHHFSHTATSVAAVTSMIAGVFAGLVASAVGASSLPVLGVLATVVAGGMFAGLFVDQERRWRRSGDSEPTRFLPDGQQVRGLVSTPTTATCAATQTTA